MRTCHGELVRAGRRPRSCTTGAPLAASASARSPRASDSLTAQRLAVHAVMLSPGLNRRVCGHATRLDGEDHVAIRGRHIQPIPN